MITDWYFVNGDYITHIRRYGCYHYHKRRFVGGSWTPYKRVKREVLDFFLSRYTEF